MDQAVLGQCLALMSAICFAFSVVFVARSEVREGDRGVFFSVLITLVFSALLWMAQEQTAGQAADHAHWWSGFSWFVFAGVCAMVLGRKFVFTSIQSLGPTRASAMKRLNPFFSVAAAALFLSEPISKLGWLGMAVIASGFALLIRDGARRGSAQSIPAPTAYLWGVAAALAYAGAYVARKLGLADLPAPAFGTLISAAAGLVFMLAAALVSSRQRAIVLGVFRNLDRWVVMASVFMSLGQILLFVALLYERISVITMIASTEIFIATFLSVVIFRTEGRPGWQTQLAGAVTMLGVIMVALN